MEILGSEGDSSMLTLLFRSQYAFWSVSVSRCQGLGTKFARLISCVLAREACQMLTAPWDKPVVSTHAATALALRGRRSQQDGHPGSAGRVPMLTGVAQGPVAYHDNGA